MMVSKKAYDRYDIIVKTQCELALKEIQALVNAINWGTTDSEHGHALNIAVAGARKIATKRGELAAAVSAEFYDMVMRGIGESLAPAQMADAIDEGIIEKSMRYATRHMWGEPVVDKERIAKQAGNDIYGLVARQANETQYRNARRDKVRYARVPAGEETCGFCLMLASRGFVYSDEEVASHGHSHCDCRIVASNSRARYEGYDPERIYDEVYLPNKVLGGDGAIDMAKTASKIEREYVAPKLRKLKNEQDD